MNVAQWAQTAITLLAAVFMAGGMWKETKNNSRRLDAHDVEIKDLGTRMTASEAWREGYTAGMKGQ